MATTTSTTAATGSQKPKSLLFLGVTGYIGSAALDALLPRLPGANITRVVCLTRRADTIKAGLESYRPKGVEQRVEIKAVQGSLTDHELLERLASEADVVVNTADADDVSDNQGTKKLGDRRLLGMGLCAAGAKRSKGRAARMARKETLEAVCFDVMSR